MPAYPRSFLRHTLLFSLPGGEVASTSCHWDNSGGGIIGTPTDAADALQQKAVALWGGIKTGYTGEVKFLGSRIATVAVDGKVVETLERAITPSPGTGGGSCLPTEVAVVASLKSATYSRSGRGRMYLPPPTTGVVTGQGRVDNNMLGSIVVAMDIYLTKMTIATSDYFSVVASKTQGMLRPVVEVKVGDVFDAQRRRRDALIEVYSTAAIN